MASINIVGDYKKSGLTQKELKDVVETVFDVLGKEKKINVAFVDSEAIRRENLKYRKINKPTDVLSFDYKDEGDILLCIDIINDYKGDDSLNDSIIKTLIHGSLHLFGYDHENQKDYDIMKKMEEKIFNNVAQTLRSESSKDERK